MKLQNWKNVIMEIKYSLKGLESRFDLTEKDCVNLKIDFDRLNNFKNRKRRE